MTMLTAVSPTKPGVWVKTDPFSLTAEVIHIFEDGNGRKRTECKTDVPLHNLAVIRDCDIDNLLDCSRYNPTQYVRLDAHRKTGRGF